MRVVYLANVGTRDMLKDGKPASVLVDGRAGPNCRAEGEAWLRDYDAIKHQLDAPILAPGLRYVSERAGPVEVVLFYSDQDETTAEVFRRGDTLFFAQILRHWLKEQLTSQIIDIMLVRLPGNPADYNRTVPFFATELPRRVVAAEVDVVYVAPVGGPDASNVGLTLAAVGHFRDKCQFIYVTPDRSVHLLNLHQELLGNYNRQEASAQLRGHDYTSLRKTLERAQLGKPWHLHVCEYADRRAKFDFARADAALSRASW